MSLTTNLLAILLIALSIILVPDIGVSSILVFIVIVGWFIYIDRKKFTRDSIIFMRRTNRGKKIVIKYGLRFSRFWKVLGSAGVVAGIAASVWIFAQIIYLFSDVVFSSRPLPGVGVLLPTPASTGAVVPGAVLVPFWYWIISIALLVIVHEGLHAIMAAAQKIKLLNFGVGLLAVIPLAFVEPDEKKFAKEKKWKQLRVLAAGSFANFIAALVIAIIGFFFFSSTVINAGVAFDNYAVEAANLSTIALIDGKPIKNAEEIRSIVNETEGLLEGEKVDGSKFFISKDLVETNLNVLEQDIVPIFPDLPAINSGLSGTITKINDEDVKTVQDFSNVLEEMGPGKEITIQTDEGEFTLTTASRPEPQFRLDSRIPLMASFERTIPGSIDFFLNSQCVITSLFGANCFASAAGIDTNTRTTYQYQIFLWDHIGEQYPDLRARAEEKTRVMTLRVEKLPEPGFIGISNQRQITERPEGLENYDSAISWINGLILWLVLINLGVGLFNTLPIFITDGARIWRIIFEKISPKRGASITIIVSIFTVIMIIGVIGIAVLRSFL